MNDFEVSESEDDYDLIDIDDANPHAGKKKKKKARTKVSSKTLVKKKKAASSAKTSASSKKSTSVSGSASRPSTAHKSRPSTANTVAIPTQSGYRVADILRKFPVPGVPCHRCRYLEDLLFQQEQELKKRKRQLKEHAAIVASKRKAIQEKDAIFSDLQVERDKLKAELRELERRMSANR